MTHLSTECQSEITTALLNRRRELQGSVEYWKKVSASPCGIASDAETEAKAREQLARVEASIVELDKRTIPWLHMHPDCAELFGEAKAPAPVGAAA